MLGQRRVPASKRKPTVSQTAGHATSQTTGNPAAKPAAERTPYRRIRARTNWPDCRGYRAHKTRFCGRLPSAAEAYAVPWVLVSASMRISAHHAGCQRSTLTQLRPADPSNQANRGMPAKTRRRKQRRSWPGRPAGPVTGRRAWLRGTMRACLTVQARGPVVRQARHAVAAGRISRGWRGCCGGRSACGPGARRRPRRRGRPRR
jgi:hypothetical protein